MSDVKKISFFLFPYLIICGALYHISFWNTYSLNGLSLISISDIIKSSVQPIFGAICLMVYNSFMSNYVTPSFGSDKPHRKGISNRLSIIIYCSIISIITALKLILKLNNVELIYVYGFFSFVFLSVYLTNNDYFQSLFNSENFRRFFIDLLVALPVICFFGGQYNSQLNYQNLEYKYTIGYNTEKNIISPTASDTLKLVGVVEDFFIFSPLNNSILIFKNKSDINNLILKDKRRK